MLGGVGWPESTSQGLGTVGALEGFHLQLPAASPRLASAPGPESPHHFVDLV